MTGPSNPAEIFEAPKLSVEKLPQLRALFERLAGTCVEDLKDLVTAPMACFLNQVEAKDSWDAVDGFENCLAAIFYSGEWDSQILIAMERRLLHSLVDIMYGGDGADTSTEGRALSKLELDLAKELFVKAATSVSNAFKPLALVSFSYEKIETEIEFTILGPQNIPCVFAQLLFQVLDSGGRMFILLPHSALLPLRKKMERGTLRESQAEDPAWTRQLQSRVAASNVKLRALVDAAPSTLQAVSRMHVGQVLELDNLADPLITLESEGAPMFKCSLGQLDGYLSVKIDKPIGPPKSLTDNVLSSALDHWSR